MSESKYSFEREADKLKRARIKAALLAVLTVAVTLFILIYVGNKLTETQHRLFMIAAIPLLPVHSHDCLLINHVKTQFCHEPHLTVYGRNLDFDLDLGLTGESSS